MSLADLSTIRAMKEPESSLAREYIQRTKELRMRRGMTQREMARALGVSLDRYKKYEVRSLLPPYLVERFAAIVGVPAERVLTGATTRQRHDPGTRE